MSVQDGLEVFLGEVLRGGCGISAPLNDVWRISREPKASPKARQIHQAIDWIIRKLIKSPVNMQEATRTGSSIGDLRGELRELITDFVVAILASQICYAHELVP